MEFTHEFTIPVGIDEALDVLTDLERVAPCMPGATLEEVDGDTYTGRVKVKVGPMSLTYTGDATVTDVNRATHNAMIEAAGREKRGAGTATADVAASLTEVEDGTSVRVITDINITGKPAQFGRGVMADVGGKIIERFADNLRDMLTEEQAAEGADVAVAPGAGSAAAAAATTPPDAPDAPRADDAPDLAVSTPDAPPTADEAGGPRQVEQVAPRDEALDLMDVAGPATAKRLAPVLAVLALVAVVVVVVRSRR